jgi:hypothetical protein
MYLHLNSSNTGRLFYSERGWFPNVACKFIAQGNQVRCLTDKHIPEKYLRHASAIFKKHYLVK